LKKIKDLGNSKADLEQKRVLIIKSSMTKLFMTFVDIILLILSNN